MVLEKAEDHSLVMFTGLMVPDPVPLIGVNLQRQIYNSEEG